MLIPQSREKHPRISKSQANTEILRRPRRPTGTPQNDNARGSTILARRVRRNPDIETLGAGVKVAVSPQAAMP